MIIAATGLGVLYFVFAGHVSEHELLAGAVAWSGSLWFEARTRHVASHRFGPPYRGLRRVLGKVAPALAIDSLRVGVLLAKILRRSPVCGVGMLYRQPCRHGGDETQERTRRALIILGKSLAPNEFVVDIPAAGDWLCVHRLAPARLADDPEWPL